MRLAVDEPLLGSIAEMSFVNGVERNLHNVTTRGSEIGV